jgi:xanthine dehydrogenase accessory factor
MGVLPVVIVKGAGNLGTGVAYRLWRAGFQVLCIDLPQPLVIRRSVAFASALYDARITVDGAQVERIMFVDESVYTWQRNSIPMLADPAGRALDILRPSILIDATMDAPNSGTRMGDAPVVVGLGPGFSAGQNCHAMIETRRGHYLGRAIYSSSAAPETNLPAAYDAAATQHMIYAPRAGQMYGRRAIGDILKIGEIIAQVNDTLIYAPIDGILRGMLHDDVAVREGMPLAEIDPRGEISFCYSISARALAAGGGALEAIFALRERWLNA